MKSKCREIFDSRMTYRQLYMPVDTAAPNTWLFSWPKFGHLLVNFLEVILYAPNDHEEFLLRQATKNSNTIEEIISWKPWCQSIADITTELTRAAEPSEHSNATEAGGSASVPEAAPHDAGSDAEEREFFGDEAAGNGSVPTAVHSAASRLESQLARLVVEPPSVSDIAFQQLALRDFLLGP